MNNQSSYEGYFKDDKMHGQVNLNYETNLYRVNLNGQSQKYTKVNGEKIVYVDTEYSRNQEKFTKVV